MRKCPNCEKKTIKAINYNFLSSSRTVECKNCNTKIGGSKNWTTYISISYALFVITLFALNLPIDKNILQFFTILITSGIVMAIIQLLLIPYEVK